MTTHDPRWIQGQTGPWEVVIGLEVHAQVISASKLFSRASTAFGAEPNSQVAWLDAGFPGALPVINRVCVEQAIKTGLGFHGTVHPRSVFDRKNYFYPDQPTGYQISQFYHPIVTGGYLDITVQETTRRIQITRLHLEQDAGKSFHDQHPTLSYVDLNRAGVALMEIVSEPDLRSAEEAAAYLKKLRTLLRYLKTCDGNMEEGSLRADANVSVRRPDEPLGTRCEIKNVNSMRFLMQAITFEAHRHIQCLESGQKIIQETRLFDAAKGETRSMRTKEDAHDYRYFPDPDLPPLVLEESYIESLRAELPELPDAKAARYQAHYGLTAYDAEILTAELETAHYYEEAVSCLAPSMPHAPKLLANWLMGDVFAALNKTHGSLTECPLSPAGLAELVTLIAEGCISGKIAKDIFQELWDTGTSPRQLVERKGLTQVDDDQALMQAVQDVLGSHADKVQEYYGGKDKLFGFFVGQAMKHLSGRAHPEKLNEAIRTYLDHHRP